MNGNNPYNCAVPGNQFVGYEDLRQDVLDGLRNGHSYALIGGRRCGKTSLLLQLAKDLREGYKLSPLWPLPRLLDTQGLDRPTLHLLFRRLYALTVEEIDAPTFSPSETEGTYQQFLAALKKAAPLMEQRYGSFWVVIFLIDELDTAVDFLPNDQFFQNLRHFLMMSDFRNHFRLVASGVTGMAQLISSGSSPLNNLLHKYLSLLSYQDAIQLILSGFRYVFDEEIKNFLFHCTGRHPYLMQGVLEKLWRDKGAHDQAAIQRAANRFLSEHSDYRRWVKSFGQAEHAVYQLLANAPGGALTKDSIRQSLGSNMAPQVGEAQLVLSYHGVIDNSDPQNPKIAGTMFRDWYQDNVPKQEKPKASEPQRPQAIRVFYSYSHQDEKFREKLETHLALLKRQKIIDTWQDRQITAGQEWRVQIHEQLEAADVILLLISADFLASDFCYDEEMTRAIQRHNANNACVIPIIVRPTDLTGAPFAELQSLPKDRKAVTTWTNEDEAWLNVAQGIRRAVEELRNR